MKLAPLRWRCKTHTGWRWFLCSHEELRQPWLGLALTFIGVFQACYGLSLLLR